MICIARILAALGLVLGLIGLAGGALLVVAWWHDRRAQRNPFPAAPARDNSQITKTTTAKGTKEPEAYAASTAAHPGA